jgi:hypothetical protein
MSFTYDPSSPDDLTRVRFHTGQTDEDESFLSDEDITFALAEKSSVGGAVVMCLQLIMSKLSRPDFKADWLQVSNGEARKGYQQMLVEKRREFGIAGISGSVVHVWRPDSLQTEAPDYSSTSTDDD